MHTRRMVLTGGLLLALGLTVLVGLDSLRDRAADSRSPVPSSTGNPSPGTPVVPPVEGPSPEDEPDPDAEPRRRRIAGCVVNREGRPVPGVTVICIPDAEDDRGIRVTARTDESGRWEVEVPTGGRYRIEVSGSIGGKRPVRVSKGNSALAGRTGVEVTVETAGVFRGRVLDPSGHPVAGARVEAWMAIAAGGKPHRTLKTRSDGSFRFLFSRATRVKLKAYVPSTDDVGLPYLWAERSDVKADDPVDLKMAVGSEIRGRITWKDGGPAAGVPLRVRWPNQARTMEVHARTDAAGGFRIGGLPPKRRCTVEVNEYRWKGASLELSGTNVVTSDATDVSLQVAPAVAATGNLYRSDGRPAVHCHFWVIHEESGQKVKIRTRKGGAFLLESPKTGTYTAWANHRHKGRWHKLKLGSFQGGESGVVLQIPEP